MYRFTRTLAAVAALAFALPQSAHAAPGAGAYLQQDPAGLTPCFVDTAGLSKDNLGTLDCESSVTATQATLTASCNGNYNFNYSQPQHASDSIYGSASSPGATYIYIECRARKHNPPNSSTWQTIHNFTAYNSSGASVSGSSFTYLPPPPVDVPENLCVYAYSSNGGTYTTC